MRVCVTFYTNIDGLNKEALWNLVLPAIVPTTGYIDGGLWDQVPLAMVPTKGQIAYHMCGRAFGATTINNVFISNAIVAQKRLLFYALPT